MSADNHSCFIHQLVRKLLRCWWLCLVGVWWLLSVQTVWSSQETSPAWTQLAALRHAARTQSAHGVLQLARQYLKRFSHASWKDEALLIQARAALQIQQRQTAASSFEQLLSQFPHSTFAGQAMQLQLPLLSNENAWKQAAQRLRRFAQQQSLHPLLPRLFAAHAQHQLQLQQPDAALQWLQSIPFAADPMSKHLLLEIELRTYALKNLSLQTDTLNAYLSTQAPRARKSSFLQQLQQDYQQRKHTQEALQLSFLLLCCYAATNERLPLLYQHALLNFSSTNPFPTSQQWRQHTEYLQAYLNTSHQTHRGAAHLSSAQAYLELGKTHQASHHLTFALIHQPRLSNRSQTISLQFALAKNSGIIPPSNSTYAYLLARQAKDFPRAAKGLKDVLTDFAADRCKQVEKRLSTIPAVTAGIPIEIIQQMHFMRGICRAQNNQHNASLKDLLPLASDKKFAPLALAQLLLSFALSQSSPPPQLLRMASSPKTFLGRPTEIRAVSYACILIGQSKCLVALAPSWPADMQSNPLWQLRLGMANAALKKTSQAARRYQQVLKLIDQHPLLLKKPNPQVQLAALAALSALQRIDVQAQGYHQAQERLMRYQSLWSKQPPQVRLLQLQLQLAQGYHAQAKSQGAMARKSYLKIIQAQDSLPETRLEAAGLWTESLLRENKPFEALKFLQQKPNRDLFLQNTFLFLHEAFTHQSLSPSAEQDSALLDMYHQLLRYKQAPEVLRITAALGLEQHHQRRDETAARVRVLESAWKASPPGQVKSQLQLRWSQARLAWGLELRERGDSKGTAVLNKGLQDLASLSVDEYQQGLHQWAQVLRNKKEPSLLIQVSAQQIALAKNQPILQRELRLQLGMAYLKRGQQLQSQNHPAQARLSYQYALTTMKGLSWQREWEALGYLHALVPPQADNAKQLLPYHQTVWERIPVDTDERRIQAVRMGQLAAALKEFPQARRFFQQADNGSIDDASLQSGFARAELEVAAQSPKVAVQVLSSLSKRPIANTAWEIPVHYRLAVLYHQLQQWQKALSHYQQVSQQQPRGAHAAYAQLITEASSQAHTIANYLKKNTPSAAP